jgi:membrane-associated HD superfamily phosphohydrolase
MNNLITKNVLHWVVVATFIFVSSSVFAEQAVYQYQNESGVTEFTDQQKGDVQAVQEIKIPKRTAEQEAQSKAKLESIIAKDKELDKAREARKQQEHDRRIQQLEAAKKRSETKDDKEKDYYKTQFNPDIRDKNQGVYPRPGVPIPISPPSITPVR